MSNTIGLKVPKLVDEPAIGSLCCAVLAEDFITDELMAISGVQAVVVEPVAGLVSITFDPDQTNISAIRARLSWLHYPAEEDAD
jgi:hypothetical protein